MKFNLALTLSRIVSSRRNFAAMLSLILAVSPLLTPAIAQQCANACFNPGCLDSSFGTCGTALTDVSHASLTSDHDGAHGLVVQSDAKLIATGDTNYEGSGVQFAAVRYNADGTLDNTFGELDPNTNQRTGVAVTPFTYQGATYDLYYASAALQKVPTATGVEERLIQTGYIEYSSGANNIAVIRYTPTGDLDTSFNGSGKQLVSFGSTSFGVNACAIQADGTDQAKIILAAGTGATWAFIRLNSDGTPDTSFGSGGKATVSFSNNVGDSLPWAVTMQQTLAGEKILAAGRAYSSKTGYDFALVRLNLNGTLDTSFGTGGKVVTDFYRSTDQARAITIDQTTGDIIAAGDATLKANSPSDFGLARYSQNGVLRSSFGSGGKVTTNFFGNADYGTGVAVQWDGKIVVSGQVKNSSGNVDFGIARYSTAGVLDSTFGSGGKVVKDFAGYNDFAYCIALQPVNGTQRIVVGGAVGITDTSNPNYGYNYTLARFLE